MHNAITFNTSNKRRITMSAFKHSVETDTGFVVEYAKQGKSWVASVYHSGYIVRQMFVETLEEARGLFDRWLDEFKEDA